MTDKPKKVDQSGFQLDKKELEQDAPMMLKPIEGATIDWVNSRDFNEDGIADISQYGPLILKLLPIIAEFAPLVHVDELARWFVSHSFITDKDKATAIAAKLIAESAAFAKELEPPKV